MKRPYSWQERHPVFLSPLLSIPENTPFQKAPPVNFHFPGWELLNPQNLPIHMEICSGNGMWIGKKAEEFPHILWVAVERDWSRAAKILSLQKRVNLNNLYIFHTEALHLLESYIPTSTLDTVYINFPDPWPKLRHKKHRIVNQRFLFQLLRVLKKDASFLFSTDDAVLMEDVKEEVTKTDSFINISRNNQKHPFSLQEYGTSFFQSLWEEKGRSIFREHWQKEGF